MSRLTKENINGKVVTFKTGLNILLVDPVYDEAPVIMALANGKPMQQLPRILSGGETLMLLLTGLPELRMSGKALVFYGAFNMLDKKNLRIALKLLSMTRNQIVLVTHATHFRKLPGIKMNVVGLVH